jgi:cytoskeleton protein RodZ
MSEENAPRDLVTITEEEGWEPVLEEPMDVGQQLRAAREARGISIDEASKMLKLSSHQVQAMEVNDWSGLPRTISRGFVRNYAHYLDLDAGPLMEALNHAEMPRGPELAVSAAASVNMPREGKGSKRDYLRVVAGLIVLILALLACFFISSETLQSTLDAVKALVSENKALPKPIVTPDGAPGTILPAPVTEAPVAAPLVPAAPVPAAPDAPAPDAQAAPVLAALPADAPAAQQAAVSSGNETLVFSFTEPSWVEVRDRGGQVIFSQTSPSGSRREVAGQPPFSLVIGNASRVTLQYKGRPIDLTQRSRDDVARLTLE